MRKALICLGATSFIALSLALISAPPKPASADTNGSCMIGGQTLLTAPIDGSPILPNCTPDRRLEVITAPDMSASPQPVTVIALPSSAPLNGSVRVTNPGDFPSPVPFPSALNVNVLNPTVVPTPIPYPSVQNVNVINPVTPPPFPSVQNVNVQNTPFPNQNVTVTNQVTPIPLPSIQSVFVTNQPTPAPAATQNVAQVPGNITYLTTAGTYVINNTPTTFFGAFNISTSAQVTAVICYNALTASGQPFLNTVLGLTNPWFPGVGISLSTAFTCNVPVSLLGNGIAVIWRKT